MPRFRNNKCFEMEIVVSFQIFGGISMDSFMQAQIEGDSQFF
jgi:hypothetical protein